MREGKGVAQPGQGSANPTPGAELDPRKSCGSRTGGRARSSSNRGGQADCSVRLSRARVECYRMRICGAQSRARGAARTAARMTTKTTAYVWVRVSLAATIDRDQAGTVFRYRLEYVQSVMPAVATTLPKSPHPLNLPPRQIPPFLPAIFPRGKVSAH